MAGPVQPHPLGTGIFLQEFSRGSCLHSLLFQVAHFGPQPGDIGISQGPWNRVIRDRWKLSSTKAGCAGECYIWGPGEEKAGETWNAMARNMDFP